MARKSAEVKPEEQVNVGEVSVAAPEAPKKVAAKSERDTRKMVKVRILGADGIHPKFIDFSDSAYEDPYKAAKEYAMKVGGEVVEN